MKRSPSTITVWLSILALLGAAKPAEAGPFRDFFRSIRDSVTKPEQKSRSQPSSRKQKTEAGSNSRKSSGAVATPPGGHNTRAAKAAPSSKEGKSGLQYGTPVPGRQGFVTSPFAPDSGYIDVRGLAPGTVVKDPYTGKTFLTP